MKNKHFPITQLNASVSSANEIVPFLIKHFKPKSVVDVGCGAGSWLSVFYKKGVKDILGLDANRLTQSELLIPEEKIKYVDLTEEIKIERKFDIAVSLEVAEHLPSSAAKNFVSLLTSLSSIVVFSAAIPFQGGYKHLNEQWPKYWAQLFIKKNYLPFDTIRNIFWENQRVKWWYAQNTIIYLHKNLAKKYPELKADIRNLPASLVHPNTYMHFWSAAAIVKSNLIAKIAKK